MAKKIPRCFQILEQDPRKHPNIKPLIGKLQGQYRYRIGDYRVIYKIDDQKAQVIVVAIAQQSLAIDREIGDKDAEARSLMALGLVYRSLEEYPKAIEYLQQSLARAC